MVTWRTDFLGGLPNGVSGPVRNPGNSSYPSGYIWDPYSGVNFASAGTVDTNTATRTQYKIRDSGGVEGQRLSSLVNVTYSSDDAAGLPAGRNMTVVLYLAFAGSFPANYVPTPMEIRNIAVGGGTLTRASSASNFGLPSWRTTAGDSSGFFVVNFLNLDAIAPNTKFWVAAIPCYSNMSIGVSGDDLPIGNANVNGRAVSMWTNRTPLAPKIKSPQTKTAVRAGSSITLSFSPQDPDRLFSFAGDIGISDLDDVAGVQVQYAPAPTTAVPDPAWTDLPVMNAAGTATTPGWWIDQSSEGAANTGVKDFMLTYSMTIACAKTPGSILPKQGVLPSGDWQIRVRTFDYGQPYANGAGLSGVTTYPPLGNLWGGSRTPSGYPAVNTSPWSTPVRVSVTEQVPKPLPLSPINNIAVTDDTFVVLTWQFRNTYNPPFTQGWRSVQIRKVGDASWFDLAIDQSSALNTYGVYALAYPLVSGNQYEWRVQVMDSTGTRSAWSDPARFWMVPTPDSGEVIPLPSETIDGATLGCGTHRVEVFRRGGSERVGELTGVTKVEWNRLRDDMSDAQIVVENWGIDCGELLKELQTWAYEIVIFRNNGFSVERVWEGPITLLTYENDKVTINAKDVVAYLYRRIIRQEVNDSGSSPTAGRKVTLRAGEIIQNALAPDDPNLLQYLYVIEQDDDAKQYRSLPAYSRTAYEEVDDMAANAGLDYTAVGRSILVWGTKHRIGTLPEFTDANLGNSPIVSEYGMSMANYYAVSDGNGVWGAADRLNSDDKDPTYGLVEMLSSTWASDSEQDSGTYTEAGLEKVRASFAQSSERSIADRYPPPVVVRVPDNTRLQPDTVISIQHLVPGVVIPLRSTKTLRTLVASQKLDSVKVVETAGEETITVTMSPFSRDDNAIEGAEA